MVWASKTAQGAICVLVWYSKSMKIVPGHLLVLREPLLYCFCIQNPLKSSQTTPWCPRNHLRIVLVFKINENRPRPPTGAQAAISLLLLYPKGMKIFPDDDLVLRGAFPYCLSIQNRSQSCQTTPRCSRSHFLIAFLLRMNENLPNPRPGAQGATSLLRFYQK